MGWKCPTTCNQVHSLANQLWPEATFCSRALQQAGLLFVGLGRSDMPAVSPGQPVPWACDNVSSTLRLSSMRPAALAVHNQGGAAADRADRGASTVPLA